MVLTVRKNGALIDNRRVVYCARAFSRSPPWAGSFRTGAFRRTPAEGSIPAQYSISGLREHVPGSLEQRHTLKTASLSRDAVFHCLYVPTSSRMRCMHELQWKGDSQWRSIICQSKFTAAAKGSLPLPALLIEAENS